MEKILKQIIEKRKQTLQKKGLSFEAEIPKKREVPISISDLKKGLIICEIKRGSPSEGKLKDIPEPVEWAGKYIEAGAGAISVLTEEDHFFGSLQDLIDIKKRYPNIPVLRKDFLLSVEEVDVSFNAGADIVLLIASVLINKNNDLSLLKTMIERCDNLGILSLIEVHDIEEMNLVLSLNPKIIGINSRDLKTFKINRAYPIALRSIACSPTSFVFESGIRNMIDSFFIGSSGFDSILVGTSIIKSNDIKKKVQDIVYGFKKGHNSPSRFYNELFKKIYIEKKVAVKICGITNTDDANLAIENGADMIGFIFADSPRKISVEKAKEICLSIDDSVLKVGVVVDENIEDVVKAVKEGWLDVIQFHGKISDEKAIELGVSWYNAVRVSKPDDFEKEYYTPIVLYDAFSENAYGGTGKRIDEKLLDHAKEQGKDLYLAGGINPENVKEIIEKYRPLMIDASSGLESSPGKKDPGKIRSFFKEINSVKNNLNILK